jgi:hypothetical protein
LEKKKMSKKEKKLIEEFWKNRKDDFFDFDFVDFKNGYYDMLEE